MELIAIYTLPALSLLAGSAAGRWTGFTLESLTPERVRYGSLTLVLLISLVATGRITGLLSENGAAAAMSLLYGAFAGLFAGYSWRRLVSVQNHSVLLYRHRSFWSDHAPAMGAILLILFGLYRTSLLTSAFMSPVRFSSGLSLITFGIAIWTLNIVPQFRANGIHYLDKIIPWPQLVSWNWQSETVVCLEVIHDPSGPREEIRTLCTRIPEEDRLSVERILAEALEKHRTERENLLHPESSSTTEIRM
ncbi:MAG: hypothetical protein WDZ29_00165 [Balneolaceae bacterium]